VFSPSCPICHEFLAPLRGADHLDDPGATGSARAVRAAWLRRVGLSTTEDHGTAWRTLGAEDTMPGKMPGKCHEIQRRAQFLQK